MSLQDGWLNRALTPMGLGDGEHALAVAQTPPLLLTGPARATSWMPATLPAPDEAFLEPGARALRRGIRCCSASLDSALALQNQAQAARWTIPPPRGMGSPARRPMAI